MLANQMNGPVAEPTPHGHPPWGLADAALAVAVVVGGTIAVAVLMALIQVAGIDVAGYLLTIVLGSLEALMFATAWYYSLHRHRVGWRALGLRLPARRSAYLLPGLVLIGSLTFTGLYAAGVKAIEADWLIPPPLEADLLGSGLARYMNMAVIGVAAPFAEEVFFRAFLMTGIARSLGVGAGVGVSAALFALAHGSFGAMLPVFVSGLLLSWLYLKTRSVWPPFIAHAAQNLLALAAVAAA